MSFVVGYLSICDDFSIASRISAIAFSMSSSSNGSSAPGAAADAAPGPDDPFDEDDIEKAIAEIRDAIEKSSQVLK